MKRNRLISVLLLIFAIIVIVIGVTSVQRLLVTQPSGTSTPLPAGSVPIYLNGEFMGAFTPNFLARLPTVQFTDVYEDRMQDGWLLSEVVLAVVPQQKLKSETLVVVSSSSREKSAQLTWAEVEDPANYVMFDLSNRGTLKLVSVLPKLDGRNEWVQDVDRIEIKNP
jgi:hypothetical protein